MDNEHLFVFSKDKSIALNIEEMFQVHQYYERLNIAEYILDNYDNIDVDSIWEMAGVVRDLVSHDDDGVISETIDDIISEMLEEEDVS